MPSPLTPEEIVAAKAAVRDGATWQLGDEQTDTDWYRLSWRDGAFHRFSSEMGRTSTCSMTEDDFVRWMESAPDVIRRMIEEHRRARAAGHPPNA